MALAPISSQSKEYLKVPVSARDSGGVVDPTGSPVAFAFLAPEVTPDVATTWTSGSWETATQPGTGADIYKARCLIGPSGAITLSAGSYDVWIRVTHNLEAVMRKAGSIRII